MIVTSDGTYCVRDINGNSVELSNEMARRIYEAFDREYYREDIVRELEFRFKDADLNKLSDTTVDEIVDEYKDNVEAYAEDNIRQAMLDAVGTFEDRVESELNGKAKIKDEREEI